MSNPNNNNNNNLPEGLPIQPIKDDNIQGMCLKCGTILSYPSMPLIAHNLPFVTIIMIYHDSYVLCPKCEMPHTLGLIGTPSAPIGFVPARVEDYPPEKEIKQHVVLPFDATGRLKKVHEA